MVECEKEILDYRQSMCELRARKLVSRDRVRLDLSKRKATEENLSAIKRHLDISRALFRCLYRAAEEKLEEEIFGGE